MNHDSDFPTKGKHKRQQRRTMKLKKRSLPAKNLELPQYRHRVYTDKEAESWAWMDEGLEEYYNEKNLGQSKTSEKDLLQKKHLNRTDKNRESTGEMVGIQETKGDSKE